MSNETESTPKDVDEPIVIPEGDPLDSDPTRTATYSVAERKEFEKTETGQAQIAQLRAETAKIEAEAGKTAAETAKIKAETEETHAQVALLGVQREVARDERWQRWIAAGLSFVGVLFWTWWMCDFIVRCSMPDSPHPYKADDKVQVALIANTGVAMIGLFAIVLRGLFKVPGEERKTKKD